MDSVVVGATGYIGKYLLNGARKLGAAVGTSSSDVPGKLTLNLQSPEAFDYNLNSSSVVFLTAAISSPDICMQETDRARGVNVTGTSIFIQQALKEGARVIFFSSDTVYGERPDTFCEAAACHPAGEYAGMKREIERRFRGNASFKSIRLSYVFSNEDKFSRYLGVCSKEKREADLFHPFFRAVVHRDDVIQGALALATHWNDYPEQVINFGGPQVISRIDFAECLREVYLHDLHFKVTKPGPDFFKNRPRIIAMTSPVFSRLLGRAPHTLHEAAKLEFASCLRNEKSYD